MPGETLLALALLAGPAPAADEMTALAGFGAGFDPAKVEVRDAAVRKGTREGRHVLMVRTGHTQEWPGITIPPPSGTWDLSLREYVIVGVFNPGKKSLPLVARLDSGKSDGKLDCNYGWATVEPGKAGELRIDIKRRIPVRGEISLFGMRGYPGNREGTVDPAALTSLVVFTDHPAEDREFEIAGVEAGGSYPPSATTVVDARDFFPFIDTFGQYIHGEWPGKVHNLDDFARRMGAEERDLGARPGQQGWNMYGGWLGGPLLEAKGFFYPAKHGDRWWLVDPDGRLFFSHGVNCVTHWDGTPLDGREKWFRDPPPDQDEFTAFHYRAEHVVNGHYQGTNPRCFNFTGANVARKYGPNWRAVVADLDHKRLRSWGLNTIGNWSDESIYLMRRTPYCVAIHMEGLELDGSVGYWGRFRDVFDPSFRSSLRARMETEKNGSAGDPWCIGYFVDNEIPWGSETELAEATLASPADQPAKKEFIKALRGKYKTIARLNAAWGTAYASWSGLAASRTKPDRTRARRDLESFSSKTARKYFSTCREEVKRVAPRNLYLGCRFAWSNPIAEKAAAEFCDVVSYNRYQRAVGEEKGPPGADVPLLIGEFHFGALDRGLFHPGLVPVRDQEARAAAYVSYVESALDNPRIVGCHWFKFTDEATTGRELDGENYQIGFLDIVDTPYPELVAASRQVAETMYQRHSGRKGQSNP